MRNWILSACLTIAIFGWGIGEIHAGVALNGAAFLKMPSPYETTGQYVHPSIIKFSEPWHGFIYWMAATPYPGMDSRKENPVILVSNNGTNWEIKAIIDETGLTEPYNSDPCLTFDGQKLWVYWRYLGPVPAPQLIYRSQSEDGQKWSHKEIVLQGERESFCSPSLLVENGKWVIYYSNTDGQIYSQTSNDGLHWGERVKQQLHLNNDPNFLFKTTKNTHLEVRRSNTGLLMLIMGDSGEHGKNLYLFSSNRGSENWYGNLEPVIRVNPGSWDGYSIYKASFLIEDVRNDHLLDSRLRIWYSAYRMNPVLFHIGYTETPLERWNYTYNLETNPWRFQEGGLFFNGYPNANGLALLEKNMTNGTVKAQLKLAYGQVSSGLVWRCQNKNNYAVFKLEHNRAILQVLYNGKQEERTYELAEATANKSYQLKLVVTNKVYTAFLDDKPILRLVSHLGLDSGFPGLFAANGNILIDDFQIN